MSFVFDDIDLKKEAELEAWLHQSVGIEKFKRGWDRLEGYLGPHLEKIKHSGIKIITIAGTNGKGETASSLAYLLKEGGNSVALWLSPHIVSLRERMLFDLKPLNYDEFESGIRKTHAEAEEIGVIFTYYELLFASFLNFLLKKHQENPIDYVVLEVGMGGRLDATNLLDAHLTAITSISRDHEDVLGRGFKKILTEKMGIMRREVPLFTAFELSYLRKFAQEKAFDFSSPYIDLFQENVLQKNSSFNERNKLLALTLYRFLKKESLPNLSDLEKVTFPPLKGRGEVMTLGERRFIFIGSHNLDGIRKLVDLLSQGKGPFEKNEVQEILVSFSKRSYEDEVTYLLKVLSQEKIYLPLYLCEFEHVKAHKFDGLSNEAFNNKKNRQTWVQDWKKFLKKDDSKNKTILVTGSFYFVGTVETYLLQEGARFN